MTDNEDMRSVGYFWELTEGYTGFVEESVAMDVLSGAGDLYGALEELYGMVWYLAQLSFGGQMTAGPQLQRVVQEAAENWRLGLCLSPTVRYHETPSD